MGAQANRVSSFAEGLTARGHTVTVVCGLPNYPSGRIFPGYQGRLGVREILRGVRVHRVWYFTTPRNRSAGRQLLSYLSLIPTTLVAILATGRSDVLMVTSPPLFSVIPALLAARPLGAKLVVDLRDLWPDEIVAVGAAREDSLSVQMLRRLERLTYRRADLITCASEGYVATIGTRGASGKTRVMPNGADVTLFRPVPPDPALADDPRVRDRFVVMYAGLLGLKHDVDVLLDAARTLKGDDRFVFVFVGGGPERLRLERDARAAGLGRVIFLGERRVEELPALLASADVCVATLRDDPRFARIVSVKLFEYMACERPVIAALRGRGAELVQAAGAGSVVAPGDGTALANAITELADAPEEVRLAAGRRGRRFVEEHYSRAAIAAQLHELLVRGVDAP